MHMDFNFRRNSYVYDTYITLFPSNDHFTVQVHLNTSYPKHKRLDPSQLQSARLDQTAIMLSINVPSPATDNSHSVTLY